MLRCRVFTFYSEESLLSVGNNGSVNSNNEGEIFRKEQIE